MMPGLATQPKGATAIDPQLLLKWRSRSSHLLLSACFDWLLIVIAWSGMALIDWWPATIIGVLVVASRLHALGAIIHDACHVSIKRKSLDWYFLELLAGWPISTTIDAMRYHHLRHHRYTGSRQDPYLSPRRNNKPLRTPLLYARGLLLPGWWTLRPIAGLAALSIPGWQIYYARLFLQDRSRHVVAGSVELIRTAKADLFQLAGQSIILGIAISHDANILIMYLIPLHLAGVLNARRLVLEHPPTAQGDSGQPSIQTVSSNSGFMFNWILLPKNLGLHREHHLYPAVAYRYLPEVQRLLARQTPDGRVTT